MAVGYAGEWLRDAGTADSWCAMRQVARSGYSLVELLVVTIVVGALLALVIPRLAATADHTATRSATRELQTVFAAAREQAIARRVPMAVLLDTVDGRVAVSASGRVVFERRLRLLYGVRLAATRDSMSYDPRGVGRGVANLRIVVRRGAASDTVFLSRLGRVRRSGVMVE
jgi:prepilin-type N-terminal cleavage/methylation domain-containing protein